MTAMDEAIAALDAHDGEADYSYRKVATRFNIPRSSLMEKHHGHTNSNATKSLNQRKINPQQEEELVQYILGLTSKGLPPTRAMIQNFASVVAKQEVGKS